jgi:heme-degrading monooxygenase HmoA
MPRFAARVQPPYYAVIFTAQHSNDQTDYQDIANRMAELAVQQPGYLGIESTCDGAGLGITVSYWRTLEDIAAWRRHIEHSAARDRGRAQWYTHYELRIARVERTYGWDRSDGTHPGNSGN